MLQDKLGAPNYCVPHGQMVLLACKAPEFDLYNNCATHCAHRVNKVICPKVYDSGIRCTYFGDTQALLLFMYYMHYGAGVLQYLKQSCMEYYVPKPRYEYEPLRSG